MVINVPTPLSKVPVILEDLNEIQCSRLIFEKKNTHMSNVTQIRPVEV